MKAIVCVDNNNGIGYKGSLLYRFREDMDFFKYITTGSVIVMGRKTYDSIGHPLPNRINVVITTDKNFKLDYPNIVLHSIDEFYKLKTNLKSSDNIFIIGGYSLYKAFRKDITELYVTHVKSSMKKSDTKFPFYYGLWFPTFIHKGAVFGNNTFKYTIYKYKRIL